MSSELRRRWPQLTDEQEKEIIERKNKRRRTKVDETVPPPPQEISVDSFFAEERAKKPGISEKQVTENLLARIVSRPERTVPMEERMVAFSKQADAFDFVDMVEQKRRQGIPDVPALHVFAIETSSETKQEEQSSVEGSSVLPSSTRHFVASTYDAIWARHFLTPPASRHFYEAIREGDPCHMYFDIEFMYEEYPDSNWEIGDRAVTAFEDIVRADVEFTYGHAVTCVIDLDSSTDVKFSRHVIVKLDGAVFSNNASVGAFVRNLLRGQASNPESPIFYKSGTSTGGVRRCMVDIAVYSRNRFMRMLGSCKWGKTATFQMTEKCASLFSRKKDAFLACLICNTGSDDLSTFSCQELLQPISESKTIGGLQQSDRSLSSVEYTPGSTPFPFLERFVDSLINTREGAHGSIRSCKVSSSGTIVTFFISGNRFCEHIGRQHKSNNVLIVCDINNCVWYRKCLDPDCALFPSPKHQLPPECCDMKTKNELDLIKV